MATSDDIVYRYADMVFDLAISSTDALRALEKLVEQESSRLGVAPEFVPGFDDAQCLRKALKALAPTMLETRAGPRGLLRSRVRGES